MNAVLERIFITFALTLMIFYETLIAGSRYGIFVFRSLWSDQ